MNYNLVINGKILISNIKSANQIWDRMKGLMFSQDLENGLLIDPCNSIHTFFMNYNIDVIFLSKDNKVVKIIKEMRPWRLTKIYFQSKKVLELKGGTLPNIIKEGDHLELVCIN